MLQQVHISTPTSWAGSSLHQTTSELLVVTPFGCWQVWLLFIINYPTSWANPILGPHDLFFIKVMILSFRGNLTVFTVLCEQYDYSLKRDPSYHDVSISLLQFLQIPLTTIVLLLQYLAKIAQLFFNVPLPPQMNNFGILGWFLVSYCLVRIMFQ